MRTAEDTIKTMQFKCLAIVSLSFIFAVTICAETKRPLSRFVEHHEAVNYDHSHLMHHHHRVRRSNQGQKQLELTFTAFEREFNVILKPDNSYFKNGFKLYKNGEKASYSNAMMYAYAGHLLDDPSSRVIGHLAYGVFDGFIKTADETYYIEPSSRYFNASYAESHSLIYRHSDINMEGTYGTTCGATTRTQQRRLATSQFSDAPSNHESNRLHKRQNTRDPNLKLCPLSVIGDYKFVQEVTEGTDAAIKEAQATNLLRNIVTMGSTNFENTDFDEDDEDDGIQFGIFELTIETTPPESGNPFSNNFIGVESFLTLHSQEDWDSFCLSYRFTARDFDDGVLGLAYVAGPNSRGGICDIYDGTRTLNTGIVTVINYGSRVATAVTALTFTHECGHNFGSNHDDPDDALCAPSDSNGGRYVMFAHATNGNRPNNNRFSPCSIDMMFPIIESEGQDPNPSNRDNTCFLESTNLCGNGLVDPGEVCDCGRRFDSTTQLCDDDMCCNGTSCTLARGVSCSPQEGQCCSANCTFEPETVLCRAESECAFNQTCNGTSAVCPPSEPQVAENNNTAIPCNGGSNFCVDGVCQGSICVPLGLEDCECEEIAKQCHVCCRLDSETCVSTIDLAETNATARELLPDNQGEVLQVGFPCNNFMGYCDFFNMCRLADSDGALSRLTDAILNSDEVQAFIRIVTTYWWALIVGVVVVLIIMFVIVLACHCLLPRPEHMKKRAERRKSIRQSRRHRIQGGGGGGGYNYSHELQPQQQPGGYY